MDTTGATRDRRRAKEDNINQTFDQQKVWYHKDFPLRDGGHSRARPPSPENYLPTSEQAAFNPMNFVEESDCRPQDVKGRSLHMAMHSATALA